jgi:hypothetical protein
MKNFTLSISILMVVLAFGSRTMAQPGPGGPAPMITEIMYNPPEANNDTLEFLEIHNPSVSAIINMGGYYFSSGIEYTFPAGFVLGAGEYVIISGDSVIFEDWYGLPAFEWTGGTALSNDGEGITLRTAAGAVADTVFFDDTNAWADADGTGYSLVLCNTGVDNNLPASWTLSENPTGIFVAGLQIYADPGTSSTCTATGIDNDNVITTLIYPNPTEGRFSMNFAPLQEAAGLTVHNNLGQLVHTQTLSAGSTNAIIDLELKAGHYIVSLETVDSTERHSLMVR